MIVRFQFSKLGKVRFTSHRDVARMWERAIRRAQLPVAHSEGFTPRPKVSFGLALSNGHESDAEYLDIVFVPTDDQPVIIDDLVDIITEVLPVGITVTGAAAIDRSTDSLQQAVTSCTWQLDVLDVDVATAERAVARALEASSLVVTRERKGKPVTDDLRPLVLSLDVIGPTENGVRLCAELGTKPRAIRPAELIAALDPPLTEGRVKRLHQWITIEDDRYQPLEVASSLAEAVA